MYFWLTQSYSLNVLHSSCLLSLQDPIFNTLWTYFLKLCDTIKQIVNPISAGLLMCPWTSVVCTHGQYTATLYKNSSQCGSKWDEITVSNKLKLFIRWFGIASKNHFLSPFSSKSTPIFIIFNLSFQNSWKIKSIPGKCHNNQLNL